MDQVMLKGPYTIRNMPMLLREWQPGFNLKNDMLRALPIWIKLPNLPLHLWGEKSLSKIGSAIGKPVTTDECTANKFQFSYARLLVEVDVTQALVKEIIINDRNGAKLVQPIEYEWKPKFCEQCQRFGHICEAPKPVKVWQPKQKQKAGHVRTDDVERMTLATVAAEPSSTPTAEGTNLYIQKNANLENWTTSTKSGRDKHKGTPKDKVLLNCTNGFGLLGDMDVSKMLVDGDPC
ncbi:unnamed protein product [Lathyrus sativus]|nr:unnamed protein product [Lathyrus sativus]